MAKIINATSTLAGNIFRFDRLKYIIIEIVLLTKMALGLYF